MSNIPKKKKKHTPYIIQDKYFHEAKRLGYRARSAFKLMEIQEQYELIKPGYNVLDIGCAPGSFLQVIGKILNENGAVVGIDIQDVKKLHYANVHLLKESIFETEKITSYINGLWIHMFDVITSDVAPNTTGHKGVDQYKSVELNIAILDVADIFLKKGWNLLLKVFVGEDVNDLIGPIKKRYETLRRCKPRACRDRSFEEYFFCMNKLT